jgi:hypothetical protein
MKKQIFALVLMLSAVLGASAQFRWGPSVGINVTDYSFKQKLITTNSSVGANAGVMAEMMFPGIGFGLDLGLRYQLHGAKLGLGEKEIWASSGYGNDQCWLHTLQIPVNLKFKYTNLNGIESKIAPFVFGGPVFSITVGHNKLDALEYTAGTVGLQCGLGAEVFERFQISGGYYWGMTYEIRTVKLSNFSARPRGWQVNLTYFIQ